MNKAINLPSSQNPRVPEPDAPFHHMLPLQIRFTDIDLLGHMNNGSYLTMMDLGKAHYFNDVLGKKVNWHEINVAVVNINVNFYAPTFLTDNIAVVTRITAMSEHSLTMEQRIVDTDSGEVKCLARTIMAGYDIKTASSQPIDPVWREAFSAYEGLDFTPAR